MAIFDEECVLASNIETFLYKKINGRMLHTYISKKYDWDTDIMQDINWSVLGEVLQSYTVHRRRKTIQKLYDWQNDGIQKMRFDEYWSVPGMQ